MKYILEKKVFAKVFTWFAVKALNYQLCNELASEAKELLEVDIQAIKVSHDLNTNTLVPGSH